jgi:hypothetical protein
MNETSNQFLTQAESNDVEKALLSSSEKFLTRLTISSHKLLKIIAQNYQVSLEELTSDQIIAWFEINFQLNPQPHSTKYHHENCF